MEEEKRVIIRKPSKEELEKLNVYSWPTWEKEESEFEWFYPEDETFYVVDGEVEVRLDDGTVVRFGKGDLVTFKKGVKCIWKVIKPIKKYYT